MKARESFTDGGVFGSYLRDLDSTFYCTGVLEAFQIHSPRPRYAMVLPGSTVLEACTVYWHETTYRMGPATWYCSIVYRWIADCVGLESEDIRLLLMMTGD